MYLCLNFTILVEFIINKISGRSCSILVAICLISFALKHNIYDYFVASLFAIKKPSQLTWPLDAHHNFESLWKCKYSSDFGLRCTNLLSTNNTTVIRWHGISRHCSTVSLLCQVLQRCRTDADADADGATIITNTTSLY